MCFSKVAKNVRKRALCLTSRSSGLCMFHTVLCVITQNQSEFQSIKLFQIDMDCTQTAQKIQTPLHVHLQVTFICIFLAYSLLRITGSFPYNLYQQFNSIGIIVTQFFFWKKKVYPKLGLSSMLTVTLTWNLLIQTLSNSFFCLVCKVENRNGVFRY